jgi:hypothetical protein
MLYASNALLFEIPLFAQKISLNLWKITKSILDNNLVLDYTVIYLDLCMEMRERH